jgi:hypothetical protein
MKKPILIILLASLSILGLDALVSFFPINSVFFVAGLWLIDLLIYAIAGFFVARHSSLRMVVLAAIVIGFVHATIGEVILWIIEPERLASPEFSAGLLLASVLLSILLAIAFALIGWFVEILLRKTQSPDSAAKGSTKVRRIVGIGIVWLLVFSLVVFVCFFIGLAVDQQEGLLGIIFGFFGLIIGIIVATLLAAKLWKKEE